MKPSSVGGAYEGDPSSKGLLICSGKHYNVTTYRASCKIASARKSMLANWEKYIMFEATCIEDQL